MNGTANGRMNGEDKRPPIKSFKDLEVYQEGLRLVPIVHRLLTRFPDYEKYELSSQMRRAAKSIPANIAEGYGKKRSLKEFRAYLDVAIASSNEMMAHLDVALSLGYIEEAQWRELSESYETLAKRISTLSSKWH